MRYIKDYEQKLYQAIKDTPDEYQETGQISGSKVSQPALTAILTMLKIEKGYEDYTLAKFMRGHDVERAFIERVFQKPLDIVERGKWEYGGSQFIWQYEMNGYRGTTCSTDVLETNDKTVIVHEIKSVGKMKYDRTCATGMFKKQTPEPDLSHCLQVTLYTLSLPPKLTAGKTVRTLIHYVNADDYRVTTFEIDPAEFKEELDNRIDAIYTAFAEHYLPAYQPYESWQKGKYNSWSELEGLTQDQVNDYIRNKYPTEYQRFKNATVGNGVVYQEEKKNREL